MLVSGDCKFFFNLTCNCVICIVTEKNSKGEGDVSQSLRRSVFSPKAKLFVLQIN